MLLTFDKEGSSSISKAALVLGNQCAYFWKAAICYLLFFFLSLFLRIDCDARRHIFVLGNKIAHPFNSELRQLPKNELSNTYPKIELAYPIVELKNTQRRLYGVMSNFYLSDLYFPFVHVFIANTPGKQLW